MQQQLLQMEKKSYSPPRDPQWHCQWSLVSSVLWLYHIKKQDTKCHSSIGATVLVCYYSLLNLLYTQQNDNYAHTLFSRTNFPFEWLYKQACVSPLRCCIIWSLQQNVGQTSGPAGLDLNVEGAWIQGLTGRGVVVSVVDDGEMSHSACNRDNWLMQES